jgi:hypothetical protein
MPIRPTTNQVLCPLSVTMDVTQFGILTVFASWLKMFVAAYQLCGARNGVITPETE